MFEKDLCLHMFGSNNEEEEFKPLSSFLLLEGKDLMSLRFVWEIVRDVYYCWGVYAWKIMALISQSWELGNSCPWWGRGGMKIQF